MRDVKARPLRQTNQGSSLPHPCHPRRSSHWFRSSPNQALEESFPFDEEAERLRVACCALGAYSLRSIVGFRNKHTNAITIARPMGMPKIDIAGSMTATSK